jgi:predicted nicotinamide N-methyase
MPGYNVLTSTVQIGGLDYLIRALSDKQQFSDADGEAERAGISSANWPMFGVLWPAGLVLAEEMSAYPVAGKRILEIGCGLALSSLVLQRRGEDITASDHHPLVEQFLIANAALNHLPEICFRSSQWEGPNPNLGQFDLIIGGDVLYERDHVDLLAAFLAEHANAHAEVLVTDPGRGHGNALSRALADQGYELVEERRAFEDGDSAPFRGRLLSFQR